eukprot:gene15951-7281_t
MAYNRALAIQQSLGNSAADQAPTCDSCQTASSADLVPNSTAATQVPPSTPGEMTPSETDSHPVAAPTKTTSFISNLFPIIPRKRTVYFQLKHSKMTETVRQQDSSDLEGDEEDNSRNSVLEGSRRMGERHKEFANYLKDRKDGKLTRRNSLEAQMLDAAKEKVALKKGALEMMENLERKHNQTMQTFSDSINADYKCHQQWFYATAL